MKRPTADEIAASLFPDLNWYDRAPLAAKIQSYLDLLEQTHNGDLEDSYREGYTNGVTDKTS